MSFLGALLGLNYEFKITDSSSLTQLLLLTPNFDDSDDWRLRSETALKAAINAWLAVKLGYEVRYRNQPIGDADSTDTTSSASVVFSF